MAASASGQLLLEMTSSKENADPSLDSRGGKWLSLRLESHKDFQNQLQHKPLCGMYAYNDSARAIMQICL